MRFALVTFFFLAMGTSLFAADDGLTPEGYSDPWSTKTS
jgi:hypothetical protein